MLRLLSIAVLGSVVLLTSCTAARPTESIRADGDWEYEQSRFEPAAVHYQQIVDRTPGDWMAQYRLGQCLVEMDRPGDAVHALRAASNLKPGSDDIDNLLAEALFQAGAEDELFAFLREQVEANGSTRAYLNLASYSMRLGDMDSASVATMTAIELDEGRSVEPYLSGAALAASVGDLEEVIRRLRQAYAIDPFDERVIARLEEYGQVRGPTLGLPPGR